MSIGKYARRLESLVLPLIGGLIVGLLLVFIFLLKSSNKLCADATFYSTSAVLDLLCHASFNHFRIYQTIYSHADSTTAIDAVIDGYGEGAFVVFASIKQ